MGLKNDIARSSLDPVAVLDKAVLSAFSLLKLRQIELSSVLGLSGPAISRAVQTGEFAEVGKSREHQLLFVRLYRALDSIVGGDDAVAAAWLRNPNTAFGGVIPLDRIKHVEGLVEVLNYLDTRRAKI